MADVDRILGGIDNGLEGIASPAEFEDVRREIEAEVWAELSGWHDPEEASERFVAWQTRWLGAAGLHGTATD